MIIEQKQAANYDNLLLDNLNTSISMAINNFHIAKIEDYINKKYNQIALEHLKSQFVEEIKHEFTNNHNNDLKNKGS